MQSLKILQIKVKPNAKISSLETGDNGTWVAKIKSSPVDGKANKELIGLLAKQFGCSRSAITIKSGESSRMKLIQIHL